MTKVEIIITEKQLKGSHIFSKMLQVKILVFLGIILTRFRRAQQVLFSAPHITSATCISNLRISEKLNLEIALTQKGFFVLWASGALETTVPMLNCYNALIGNIDCKHDKLKKDLLMRTCNGVRGWVGNCYSLLSPGHDFATLLIKNMVSISEAFSVTEFTDIINARMHQNIRYVICSPRIYREAK